MDSLPPTLLQKRPDPLETHGKKVVFKLHDSYPNNTRTFTEGPPYEVTETGWGEFEIIIKIYWNVEGKQNDRNPVADRVSPVETVLRGYSRKCGIHFGDAAACERALR